VSEHVDRPAPEQTAGAVDDTQQGGTGGTGPFGGVVLEREEMARRVFEELERRGADIGATVPAPMREWDLVASGRVPESLLCEVYAAVTGLPVCEEEEFRDLQAFPEVTYDYLTHYLCVPLSHDRESVLLAIAHPYDIGALTRHWTSLLGLTPECRLARRTLIERTLTELYDTSMAAADQEILSGEASEEMLRDLAREAPIVRLVNDIFTRAVESGASDIHIEPDENELAVRFRIDGVLQKVMTPPLGHYPAIASRIKLLAGMNIAEHRLPQDGRIDLQISGAELDVRVSTVPSMHGESIVLRLLPKDTSTFDLHTLGLAPDTREEFERLIRYPHGMILVVGPTGSGKTTTLYSVMKLLNSETRKIITIEDPVEYQLPGLTQIQVRPQIGLTFANGLRSIVRQDPDIILVGEIRDRETAEIAIHAALTGHLVLSTLHTNDAAGAISRLLEMGVESFLISSALLGVLSQRLVRRICSACRGKGSLQDPMTRQEPKRCPQCQGRGYRGRVGIFELLVVDDEIRQAINEHQDSTRIAAIARRHGMRTLREDGELKVRAGITTEAEVARVCQLDVAVE